MATCNLSDLIDQACANQFTCLEDEKKFRAVVLQLLCNLSVSGGALQQVFTYAGDPNGHVLVATANPCICIDTVNNITWAKTDGIISNTGWV